MGWQCPGLCQSSTAISLITVALRRPLPALESSSHSRTKAIILVSPVSCKRSEYCAYDCPPPPTPSQCSTELVLVLPLVLSPPPLAPSVLSVFSFLLSRCSATPPASCHLPSTNTPSAADPASLASSACPPASAAPKLAVGVLILVLILLTSSQPKLLVFVVSQLLQVPTWRQKDIRSNSKRSSTSQSARW